MPTKGIDENKVYFMVDGELKPFTEIKEIENNGFDSHEKIEIAEFPEYEATFVLSRKSLKELKKLILATRPRLFINNWRKMHHLPMIRRRGKREWNLANT